MGRNYPPLVFAGFVLLLLLGMMPSALNLPQSSPSQTLEYAPVPPEGADSGSRRGNFAALGLAGSSDLQDEAGDLAPPTAFSDATPGGRAVKIAGTKRCVGTPPRQTEDPASPPCVASFTGDNGGATYHGTDAAEVRIIVYVPGGFVRPTSRGSEASPVDQCFDLGAPADEDDDIEVRFHRTLQRYFNDRYQTYGRFVRFVVCFDGPQSWSVEGRRAAAAEHRRIWDPFAVVSLIRGGTGPAYEEVMLNRGVLRFSAALFQPASVHATFAPLSWGYAPSIEEYADHFSSFVCHKVVGHPTSFSGNNGENGSPRKLGLLYTDNGWYPELQAYAEAVRDRIVGCGGRFVAEGRYPYPYTVGHEEGRYLAAQANMTRFRDAGVTTVIWPGGWESDHTKVAAAMNYRPEWLSAGDGEIEGYDIAQFQEQSVWRHAWVIASQTREGLFEDSLCYQALREADPEFPRQDAEYACPLAKPYESFRQLFTGIQVAGPRLHPDTLDKGYHAIPAVRSQDPRVPACFYETGDYTCVKDAAAMWWDSDGTSRNGRKGCWKMPEGGRRYLRGTWPGGDVLSMQNRADVCNGYAASVFGT